MIYGQGISKDGEVLDLATDLEIVEKSGAWYSYKGEKIGQGRENSKNYLKTHQDVFEEISNRIRAKISGEEIQEEVQEETTQTN